MHLSSREHEAFVRGQAAGLIPEDYPVPENETQDDDLILHIGVMFSRTVGCRTKSGRLFLVEVAAFSEEYLPELIQKLPQLHPDVFFVTRLQRETFPAPLAGLADYFALGPGAMDEKDLADRLAVHHKDLTIDKIRKGFDLDFAPEPVPGAATFEQRMILSERIARRAIPTISRRTWEALTEREATGLLSQTPPEKSISPAVRTAVRQYKRLSPEEKILFRELTTINSGGTHD